VSDWGWAGSASLAVIAAPPQTCFTLDLAPHFAEMRILFMVVK
jgi:hypothetical protein